MIRCKDIFVFVFTTLAFAACVVHDDISYPIVEGRITAFEVEGQCNADDNGFAKAVIDKEKRTVDVYVSDTIDLSKLRIDSIGVSNDATIHPMPERCLNADAFPTRSFRLPVSGADSRVDFSGDSCQFIIRTYQDYDWNVRVHQVMLRKIRVSGQVGDAVVDPLNKTAVIYVSRSQKLSQLSVSQFNLGGQHGYVVPDPTATATYDFSKVDTFEVHTATGHTETWHVFAYKTDATEGTTTSVYPHSAVAYISGKVSNGTTPIIEYHAVGMRGWTTVDSAQISQKDRDYTAKLTGLCPNTTYCYRITSGSSTTAEKTFTTAGTQQLENAGFESWSSIKGSSDKELWQPWGEGETPYWGTGNAGATTVGASNSTYGDEDGHRYANLQSKYIVIKFAAGNIFTGEYLKTDGSNGILGFGRPFTAYPTKLRFDYKYHSETINRTGGDWKSAYGKYITQELYESLKGQPDSCCIYVALGDWPEQDYDGKKFPIIIRTRPSELSLLNLNDEHIIAYGELTKGEDVSQWTTHEIDIEYRVFNRQPKFIIIVASSSKYGDYFTGGEGSLLQIDNFELLYE